MPKTKMEKMITGLELGICSPNLQILLQIPEQPVQIVWIIAQIVVPVRHNKQIEGPVGIDEGINKLHGHAGIDIVIYITCNKQQLSS